MTAYTRTDHLLLRVSPGLAGQPSGRPGTARTPGVDGHRGQALFQVCLGFVNVAGDAAAVAASAGAAVGGGGARLRAAGRGGPAAHDQPRVTAGRWRGMRPAGRLRFASSCLLREPGRAARRSPVSTTANRSRLGSRSAADCSKVITSPRQRGSACYTQLACRCAASQRVKSCGPVHGLVAGVRAAGKAPSACLLPGPIGRAADAATAEHTTPAPAGRVRGAGRKETGDDRPDEQGRRPLARPVFLAAAACLGCIRCPGTAAGWAGSGVEIGRLGRLSLSMEGRWPGPVTWSASPGWPSLASSQLRYSGRRAGPRSNWSARSGSARQGEDERG
jgi:hypothetical protein